MGITLANMVPEKRFALMARAWAYGNNRLGIGFHYASDREAGRLAGTAIASVLANIPEFEEEFDAAKAEFRPVLGLKKVFCSSRWVVRSMKGPSGIRMSFFSYRPSPLRLYTLS